MPAHEADRSGAAGPGRDARILHQPGAEAAASRMAAFLAHARATTGLPLPDWAALSAWSTESFRDFWRTFLAFMEPLYDGDPAIACEGDTVETARFFPGLALNYAENLLRSPDGEPADRVVLAALDERGTLVEYTRARLRGEVLGLAGGLSSLGLGDGSRVCALARNDAAAVVACLGAAAIGASWASVSPDLGPDSILSRFGPLAPALLFVHTRLLSQGQARPLKDLVARLLDEIPSIRTLVLLDDGDLGFAPRVPVLRRSSLVKSPPLPRCRRVAFDHPLFVLFSSGTTGPPKCIVHGHGGTLLEHLKELALHTDLSAKDTICFITSTGWMMWNWVVSGLATGAKVLLYDGSVSWPEPDSLPRALAAQGVTVFGTSPAYLRFLQDTQTLPRERCRWDALRSILSTGSILYEDLFDFSQRAFGPVPLNSISGGSDILGCFVLGNPLLPVRRGESPSVSLGLDVRARNGETNRRTGTGDLVCVKPFPSRPVGLYGDADGRRFHDAYFSQHEGVWTHGDLIELTASGGARILGRSDGVLNIRGIRIGPAEVYGVVGRLPEILEAMAVDQSAPEVPGGRKLVLLVVLKAGIVLDKPLTFRIKRALKDQAGMTHVPDLILPVAALPQTHNGKRSERAVQDLLNGRRPRNLAAIRNPEALRALLPFADLGIDPALLPAGEE